MATYQEQHTQFVSNLTGTTFSEVMLVSLQLPLSVLLVPTLLPLLWPELLRPGRRLLPASAARLTAVVEFGLIILPLIGALTVLADHALQLCVALASCAALSVCALAAAAPRPPPLAEILRRAEIAAKRLPCVTNARAHLHLVTAAAILAVDFRAFPRRLAKAETFGAGLMDMAVGSYVISHGMTSQTARAPAGPRRPLRERLEGYQGTARRVAVLVVLGCLRLLLVKATGYHEHETEYGRHCNFFFTLAAVKLVGEFWLLVVPASLAAAAAVLLTLLQQYLLNGGLQLWVTDAAARSSLLEANREAVASVTGFLALYFCGVALGSRLSRPRAGWLRWLACLAQLSLVSAGLWRLAAGMNASGLAVSRRLCNSTYVVASAACCLSGVAAYLCTDLLVALLAGLGVTPRVRVPRLMAAASRQGLPLFCLANLATGAVNLSMRTIEASDAAALTVVTVYMAGLVAVIVWLDTREMSAQGTAKHAEAKQGAGDASARSERQGEATPGSAGPSQKAGEAREKDGASKKHR